MDQQKIGILIKELRKKHHLTQKQFAEKYHVTFQAVSKWENGLNLPDTALLKQISEDFHISMDELLAGELNNRQKKSMYFNMIMAAFMIVLFSIIMIGKPSAKDFQFKILSAECDNFQISGSISYNENKSAIYITNIKYCGGDDSESYESIECVLYESNQQTERKISTYQSNRKNISLENFLREVTLSVDNYQADCHEYQKGSLYLLINARNTDNKTTTYKIPLKPNNCAIY